MCFSLLSPNSLSRLIIQCLLCLYVHVSFYLKLSGLRRIMLLYTITATLCRCFSWRGISRQSVSVSTCRWKCLGGHLWLRMQLQPPVVRLFAILRLISYKKFFCLSILFIYLYSINLFISLI